jgi:hypothetical protein
VSLLLLSFSPAQVIPLTVFDPVYISLFQKLIEEKKDFGVRFGESTPYGTLAQIFEYCPEASYNAGMSVKARGRHRFKVTTKYSVTHVDVICMSFPSFHTFVRFTFSNDIVISEHSIHLFSRLNHLHFLRPPLGQLGRFLVYFSPGVAHSSDTSIQK